MDKSKGFTLIELLVVIAIIALLMAILIPSLTHVKNMASGVVCQANVKNLVVAWVMYAQDNDGKIVGGDTLTKFDWVARPIDGAVESKKEAIREGLLFSYLKDVKVYHCPADKRYRARAVESSSDDVYGGYRSYSVAGSMNGQRGWGQNDEVMVTKITQIKRPAEKYVFLEEMEGGSCNLRSWDLDVLSDQWTDPVAIWHNKRSTLGYADGHMKMHPWVDKGTLKMAELQMKNWPLWPSDSGDDLRYMKEHYQPKGPLKSSLP